MNTMQEKITETLFKNAGEISFGSVSVELKIHTGKCVGVTYTTYKSIRETEKGDVKAALKK